MPITLNADLGEGYGRHSFGNDEALMPLLDLANVACGFHAGDPMIMEQTVALAAANNVAVGAHPSLPDLQGFGRRRMNLSAAEVKNLIRYQTGALVSFLQAAGMPLNHIKPHGALYGMLAADENLMQAAADVCEQYQVAFLGMPGTIHEQVCTSRGIPFVRELYVDMSYGDDGVLIIGGKPHTPAAQEVAQTLQTALATSTITSVNGKEIHLEFDSVCIHSDGAASAEIAAACREILGARS